MDDKAPAQCLSGGDGEFGDDDLTREIHSVKILKQI